MTTPIQFEHRRGKRGVWIYKRPDSSYSLYRYHCSTDTMVRKYEDTAGIPYTTLTNALLAGQEWLKDQEKPRNDCPSALRPSTN